MSYNVPILKFKMGVLSKSFFILALISLVLISNAKALDSKKRRLKSNNDLDTSLPQFINTIPTPRPEDPTKSNCKARDYRSKLPPTRDQDSMGWCFAFTAADLLSFKSGKGRDNPISAMDLSTSHFNSPLVVQAIMDNIGYETPTSQTRGGWTPKVLGQALREGACLEKDFPSQDFLISKTYIKLKKLLAQIESYSTQTQAICQDCESNLDSEIASAVQAIVPNVDPDVAVRTVRSVGPDKIIYALKKLACKNKVKFPFKSVTTYRTTYTVPPKLKPEEKEAAIAKVQEQLNNGNIVAFHYNAKVLSHDIKSGNHASSIVAQRWNEATNKCEFLVRNSWGRTCHYYYKGYDCEEGHIWIPAKNLMGATSEVIYIN